MITMTLGGQYGSEGKGSVSSWFYRNYEWDLVIRSGAPNAGHTFKDEAGNIHKMRQFPCSWSAQPTTTIYLSASTIINKEVFQNELKLMIANGYEGLVLVSPYAALISEEAELIERDIKTGTTGEGVGATRAMKCLRSQNLKLVKDDEYFKPFIDEWKSQHLLGNLDKQIFIEGHQGYALSLDGSRYPYVTSTNLTTYRILDDCEIFYNVHKVHPVVIFRTFPIRIAGNSGYLFNETSWAALRERHGMHISDEQTTVTKKTRRVGEFDPSLAQEAVRRLGADIVVLTFVDYIFPDIAKTGLTDEIRHWVVHMSSAIGQQVDLLGIGIGELIRAH